MAAQQMLLQGALRVMESRDLGDIDAWLSTARELDLVESHEVQSVLRLRSTLVEDQAILGNELSMMPFTS